MTTSNKTQSRVFTINNNTIFTFYRRLLEVMGVFPPVTSLSPSERDLLAKLMEKRYNYKSLSEKEIAVMLFSKSVKEDIMAELKINKMQVLDNALTSLRKKGVVYDRTHKEPNTLAIPFRINADEGMSLIFKFTIE